MELGFALGLTVAGLPDDLLKEFPHVSADAVVVLGPRDERELAEAGVRSIADVVMVVRPDQLAAHPEDVASAAVAHGSVFGPAGGFTWISMCSPGTASTRSTTASRAASTGTY